MKNILINLKNDYVSNIMGKDIVTLEELLEKIVELDAELEKKEEKTGDYDYFLEQHFEDVECQNYTE
jgi:hypothetical protein